jgi:hypothetical protein
MERREFTVLSALALLGGATITVTGCGGNPMGASGMGDGSVNGAISANHGHAAAVTAAQLNAGGDLSLHIQAQADHDHVVALTRTQVVSIRGGGTVAIESTETKDHHHTVTFAGGSRSSGSGY